MEDFRALLIVIVLAAFIALFIFGLYSGEFVEEGDITRCDKYKFKGACSYWKCLEDESIDTEDKAYYKGRVLACLDG